MILWIPHHQMTSLTKIIEPPPAKPAKLWGSIFYSFFSQVDDIVREIKMPLPPFLGGKDQSEKKMT